MELFNEDERSGHSKDQKKAEFDSTSCQLRRGEEKKKRIDLMVKETWKLVLTIKLYVPPLQHTLD